MRAIKVTQDGIELVVPINSILYFMTKDSGSLILLVNGSSLMVTETLDSIYSQITGN